MLVWKKENIERKLFLATVLCTIIVVHKGTSSSYRSVDYIRLWSYLSSKRLYVSGPHGAVYIFKKIFLLTSFSLPFSELSVLWHCWLCYTTHKIVYEMTYNVSSGTLNPTIPIPIPDVCPTTAVAPCLCLLAPMLIMHVICVGTGSACKQVARPHTVEAWAEEEI